MGNDCYILASEDHKGKNKMQASTVLKYVYSKKAQVFVCWKESETYMFAAILNIPCKVINYLTGMESDPWLSMTSLEAGLGLWSGTICKVGF